MQQKETPEQLRARIAQKLYQQATPAELSAALSSTDSLIDALSQNSENHFFVPGTLAIIHGSVDRIIEKARRDVTYIATVSTEHGGFKETQTFDLLKRAQAAYPDSPKQFHFSMINESDTQGRICNRVDMHDSTTLRSVGMARIILRAAPGDIVEITVEPDWDAYDRAITTSATERTALDTEREAIQHAFANKLVVPTVTKAQMRNWSTRNILFRSVEQKRLRQARMAGIFVYNALFDGLYAETATTTARTVARNVSRAQLQTQIGRTQQSSPTLAPQVQPPRPTWPITDNERHAFFDYFEQHAPEVSDKKIGEYYGKSHTTVRNMRSSLGRKRK